VVDLHGYADRVPEQAAHLLWCEYLWSSANLQAFSQLPIPRQDREVILEQWRWMREVPKVPGSYMLEREISNPEQDRVQR